MKENDLGVAISELQKRDRIAKSKRQDSLLLSLCMMRSLSWNLTAADPMPYILRRIPSTMVIVTSAKNSKELTLQQIWPMRYLTSEFLIEGGPICLLESIPLSLQVTKSESCNVKTIIVAPAFNYDEGIQGQHSSLSGQHPRSTTCHLSHRGYMSWLSKRKSMQRQTLCVLKTIKDILIKKNENLIENYINAQG